MAGCAEVAFDGRNYCVAWPECSDPQHPRILAGRVRPDGVVLDTLPVDVFPKDTGVVFLNAPDIAFGDSVFLIVACWDSLGYENIIGSRLSPQGVLLDTTAIPVSCPVSHMSTRWQPRVSFNGSFFQVVWYGETGSLRWVAEGARVEPSGRVLDTVQVGVVRDTTGVQHDPNVASSRDGRSLVVWGNEAGGEFNVYGVFVDTSGRQVGVEVLKSPLGRVDDEVNLAPPNPNPMRGQGEVTFSPSVSGRARLAVYDALGRKVRVLLDEEVKAGSHRVRWVASDDLGRPLPSGVYFFKLEALGQSAVQKVVVVR